MKSVRILIVEDQQAKIAKVMDVLIGTVLCDREQIDVAQSGVDARRLLADIQYDLLILDVVLPNRPEETPQKDGGVELLREVMERELLNRPRYVIGLTAFPDAFQSAAGEFADYTWAIVQYEERDDTWHDPIVQLLKHISRTEPKLTDDNLDHDSDICVITALQMELDSLRTLGWAWNAIRMPGDATTYMEAMVGRDKTWARVVAATCPRMGMVSAAVLATNMIRTFRPRLTVITGICAGLRDRVSIGDIVVADPSWDYQSGKVINGEFQVAPHQLPLVSAVRRRLSELDDPSFLAKIKAQWAGPKPKTELKLHIGPFASGSAVLADKKRLNLLKQQHRQLIAIDMEAYGIYAAASESPMPIPYAVAIKGVSDFGDESKGDEFREYASHVSASVFGHFVENDYFDVRRLLWP